MPDLIVRRKRATAGRRQLRSLTAAAKILAPNRAEEPQPEHWHPEAWFYRNNTGELRAAETWLAGGMGGARLFAGIRRTPSADPEELPENHPAQQLVGELAGGIGGQSALLRAWAVYLMTPGVGYMIGFDPRDGGGWTWQVRSADEVRLSSRLDSQGLPMYEVRMGETNADWMPLDGGIVVRVHRPDPEHHWRPDSPVRGAFPILSELVTLGQAIQATAVSRLAGAGLLPLPDDLEFEGGWDAFVDEFVRVITSPIADRGSAAAVVPFLFKVKAAHLGKLERLDFSSPFDEHSIELRQELRGRLATAMDMPTDALTGEQQNHWGKAQSFEEGLRINTEPNLALVCDGITKGYLLPGLLTEVQQNADLYDLPTNPGMMAQALQAHDIRGPNGEQIVVWYDLSDFAAKADKGEDTVQAYDRFEAGGEALRAETGLSGWAPPDDAEVHRRLTIEAAKPGGDATIQRAALIKLGVFTEDELPEPVAPAPPGAGPDDPDEPEDEAGGPTPLTSPDDPAPSEDDPGPAPARDAAPVRIVATAGPVVDRALVAAADALVFRAIERAGNRTRQAIARRSPGRRLPPELDRPAHEMHLCCHVTVVAGDMDDLLVGAWERLPEVAAHLGHDADALRSTLDTYVRQLLAARRAHTWPVLEAYLAASPPQSPADLVLANVRRSA